VIIREFLSEEHILCPRGHPQSRHREPVEHDVIECPYSYRDQHQQSCGAKIWILQLDGGRRLVVGITDRTAEMIRRRRMRTAEILDMLGVLRKEHCAT
jgi:hypothetical protein